MKKQQSELAQFCKTLKDQHPPKKQDPTKPVSIWSEKDVLNKKITDAFVIIFRTQGCTWSKNSGCSMCGYSNDSIGKPVTEKELTTQLETSLNRYSDQKIIKIFNSGSFFDEQEIKPKIRNNILEKLSETADKISVESRPQYIKENTITETKKILGTTELEVGIGLETANDFIREHAINKGFTFNDYKKAATTLKKHDVKLKTYVLIKPPFLTEKKAISDAINTTEKIKTITDMISFNPMNIQRGTLVEYLWRRKQYQPPWLWSLIEILKESKKIANHLLIKCDISGGGSIRGANNCKQCNHQFLKTIADFSLEQDINIFKKLDCNCKEKWLDELDLEDLSFGSQLIQIGEYQ